MYSLIPARRSFGNLYNMLDAFDRDMSTSMMRTDITDEGNHLELRAELPGCRREDIDMEIENGILTIAVNHSEENEDTEKKYLCRERRICSMKRSFQLEGIQEKDITASFEDGVLVLKLPKQETKVSRKIALA